ncbi:hypothetical protein TNCV_992951 [Trichonephila clavipes]|nr:hypothetical protein TNCV_992951 [Trichonephila clavipes]
MTAWLCDERVLAYHHTSSFSLKMIVGRIGLYLRLSVYVADDLIRPRFQTKDEKGRMRVTNPSVTFIRVHSPAKRAHRSHHFKNSLNLCAVLFQKSCKKRPCKKS